MLKTLQSIKLQDKKNRSVLVPQSVQELVPVTAIYENGIFRHGQDKYSICYKFTDVNFCVSSDEDQEKTFYKYEDIINAYDLGAEVKLTINNKHIDMKTFEKEVLLNLKDDGLDFYRKEYNKVLLEKINESNTIIQEKYITISVFRKSLEEAKAAFARMYTELRIKFNNAGSTLTEMTTEERLQIFYDFFRGNEPDQYNYNFASHKALGHSFKDFICPDDMELIDDHTIRFGDKYARVMFLRDYANYNKVEILPEFTEVKKNLMLSIDSILIPTDEAVKDVEQVLLGAEANISKWGQRQVQNKNFVSEVPPQLEEARKEVKDFLNDLTARDQKMLLCILTLVHVADSLEELDNDTASLKAIAAKNRCQLAVLRWQQLQGLNTVLPWGVRELQGFRTLSSEQLASFMPFHVQDVMQPGGEYFGQNAVNKNLIIADKTKLKNGNSWILGTSGAGKSFAAKEEITNYLLGTDGDIIIIDPEREYTELVESLGGSVINISATSDNHINALYINKNYADGKDPITMKSQFVMSLCQQALKREDLTSRDESIIDRCVRNVYKDFVESDFTGTVPTLRDFYDELMLQEEEEAHQLALALELFTTGSLNTFAIPTNVDIENRLICYDINELTSQGEQLAPIGMLIILDSIMNRLTQNRQNKKNTYVFIDEIYLLFKYSYAAEFLFKLWKRIRKYYGFCTGITQNVTDLLQSHTAETMLANSEFIVLLSQSAIDIPKLQEILYISDAQLAYITEVPPGHGLLKVEKNLIPFANNFPRNTKLYELYDTSPTSIIQRQREAAEQAELDANAALYKNVKSSPNPVFDDDDENVINLEDDDE